MHHLIVTWFEFVHQYGYLGVFLMMAVESSIVPLPSEIVIPPAAYWAAQGQLNMSLVVLAGTAGSLVGSLVMYGVSLAVGRPFVLRFGKYMFLPPERIEMAERFILQYSAGGIFFSRLLPVLRHLCSIPAGLSRMKLGQFALLTTLGAGLWCTVLAWFGKNVIGDDPDLLKDPNALRHVLGRKLIWFAGAAVVMLVLYIFVTWFSKRGAQSKPAEAKPAA